MYRLHKKSLCIIIGFLTALLAFSIIYMGIYNIPGTVREIKALRVEVQAGKEMLSNQNLELNALSISNQTLRLDIVDKDLEIIRLEVAGMAYEDMVTIFEFCLNYIYVMQLRMDEYGVAYPEFIVESVMLEILTEGIE